MAKISFGDGLTIDEDKLINNVLGDVISSIQSRGRRVQLWQQNLNQVRGILPAKTEPWEGCSNINVPVTEIHVNTYHANIMRSFFGTSKFIDVKPVSKNDEKTAEKREHFLNWQLINEIKIREVADKCIEMALIFGDCFIKVRYVRDVRIVFKKQTILVTGEDGNVSEVVEEIPEEQVVRDNPVFDVLNIEDVFLPQMAVGVQKEEGDYVIVRTRISKAEYMRLVEEEDYTDIDLKEKYDIVNSIEESGLINQFKNLSGISVELEDPDNSITLLEWYGTFYNEKVDRYEEIIAIIHPGSRTVCKGIVNEFEFRPIVKFTPIPNLNQVYGRGLPEVLKYVQAELNTVHNQRIDSATRRIMGVGFYNEGSSFDPQKYKMAPLGMYPVDNVANLLFPSYQDAPTSQYREEEMLWRYAEQLTGASENIQGILSRQEKTATEITATATRGSIRFDLVYQRFEDSFIKAVYMAARFDQEKMPPEKEFRVVGSDGRFRWVTIKDQEMGGKLDLMISGASILDEQMQMQKAQLLYNANISNPIVASDQKALYENLKFLNLAIGGRNINIDRLLPVPPQAATRTPQEEHDLMYEGKKVNIDIREDAQLHLLTHDAEQAQPEFKETISQEVQQIFAEHSEETKALIAAQTQMQQQFGTMQNVGSSPIQPGSSLPAPQPGQAGIKNVRETQPRGTNERQPTPQTRRQQGSSGR